MKILIAEDEKVSQKKMEMILANYGICDVVANGEMALELFKKGWRDKVPYDLITLDITLHEMSGLDVLMEIRQIEKNSKVPGPMTAKVVMVTSHDDVDHISTSATCGANGYIIKPFTKESIIKSLRNIYIKHIKEYLPDR